MSSPRRGMRALVVGVAMTLAATLAACDNGADIGGVDAPEDTPGVAQPTGEPTSEAPVTEVPVEPATISTNLEKRKDVPVSTRLQVLAQHGRLSTVTVVGSGEAGTLPGTIADGGGQWEADDLLEPGTTYTIKASIRGEDGETVKRRQRFTTQSLTLDQQTYPSIAPLPDETVGIGMPVIVTFDIPVTDRANIERNLHVTAEPAQPGTWHWVSGREVHYRPKKYWKAGTKVNVKVDINGVDAGNGIYGQMDREIDFKIGDANISKVDMKTHEMKVFSNGKLLRTLPITTGEQPKFTTRSGVKVIMEKFDSKRMNSETVGIPVNSADGYDLENVQWAMRLTYSGEFIHAAPWSVGSQGRANVSHGCTGMSTANADWLYHRTLRGDVVEYVGTERRMEPGNGYGDWNVPWREYKQGSALS